VYVHYGAGGEGKSGLVTGDQLVGLSMLPNRTPPYHAYCTGTEHAYRLYHP